MTRDSGARTSSATQPPSSRAEPGATGPPRSGDPERIPLPRPGPRPRRSVPEPKGSALRVVLVSRDTMLAGALRSLLEAPGGVRVLDWYSEDLDAAIRHADVVIVDMPPNLHERTFAVIDGRFLGRTVVLLEEGEHAEALPPGPPRAVLYRPVQIGELWTAVTGATPPAPAEPEPPSPEETTGSVGAEVAPAVGSEVEVEAQGLPVTGSGRLIGLSGQELGPVIGPGQVAPGMDQATLERLRGWGSRGGQPTAGGTGPAPGTRHGTAGREAGQAKAAQEEARQAARTEAERARAEEQRTARAEARQAKAAEAKVRREQAQQAKAALGRPGVRGLLPIALIGVAVAGVGLGAAGWRGVGGPTRWRVRWRWCGLPGGVAVWWRRTRGWGRPSRCMRWRWGRGCGRRRLGGRWRGRSGRPGCRAGLCWRVWWC